MSKHSGVNRQCIGYPRIQSLGSVLTKEGQAKTGSHQMGHQTFVLERVLIVKGH